MELYKHFGLVKVHQQVCACRYKSLCVAVMICATLVNTQTHRKTDSF